MNFYKHHIGDYQKKTATLSILEHGVYLLMLQHYYATEEPLPKGRELYRMLRAESKADREAIDKVAARFWTETDAGLVNKRATEEIEKAALQRAINAELGKRGGRPRKTESVIENKTETKTESVSETEPIGEPNRNPSQTPDSRLQTNLIPPTPLPGGLPPRGRRKQPVRPCPAEFEVTDDMLAWAVDEGVPDESVMLATERFLGHHRAKGSMFADWSAAWMNWMRNEVRFARERRA